MSLAADTSAAIGAAAAVQGSVLKLGSRPAVPCVADEVEIEPATRDGRITEDVIATVAVSASGFGARPKPDERGTLEHGGETYQIAVSGTDPIQVQAAGNLYQFVVKN